MPDRILTATASDGSYAIVAGITTDLVTDMQRRHVLSPTASAAVGRLLTGAALLGASLKGREKLTLQVAGDGPIRGVVADVALTATGAIGGRGYARNGTADLPLNAAGKFDVAGVVGKGVLQVTRSFEVGQPYVGITELVTGEIGDDIAAYLARSEQIASVVALGVLANPQGIRAAGGLIVQLLPSSDEGTIVTLEARAAAMPPVTAQIADGASVEDLIASMTGGDVRATREYALEFACSCSFERVERTLLGLGRDELEKMIVEQPHTDATCEFCKTTYTLSHADVRSLIDRLEASR